MVFCDLLPSESPVSLPFQGLNVLVPSKLNVFLRPGSRPGNVQVNYQVNARAGPGPQNWMQKSSKNIECQKIECDFQLGLSSQQKLNAKIECYSLLSIWMFSEGGIFTFTASWASPFARPSESKIMCAVCSWPFFKAALNSLCLILCKRESISARSLSKSCEFHSVTRFQSLHAVFSAIPSLCACCKTNCLVDNPSNCFV